MNSPRKAPVTADPVQLFPADDDGIAHLDWNNIGSAFPIKQRRAYLNNASIGALSLPVVAAVNRFMEDVRDNGRNAYPEWCRYAEETIKGRIGQLIGADRNEIAFVKNTTEGLVNVANGFPWKDGDNVILADIEYPSNVYCWMKLASRGVSIRWVKNQDGRILVDDVRAMMDARTRMVSLSAVQFSNGFRQDLEATANLCNERGVFLNLDAIQWVGVLALDVEKLGVHFLSTGGHKWMLSPIGTGFFYCRKSVLEILEPTSVGYHSVDSTEDHMDYVLKYRSNAGRFEEALANFTGIWGMDAAVRTQLKLGPVAIEQHILGLNEYASSLIAAKGYRIISSLLPGERSGNLAFRHATLDAAGIAQRLREARVDLAVRGGNLRISPSFYNDKDEIERLVDALPN